jgi:predicted DNA binding CopG/RHH family protein
VRKDRVLNVRVSEADWLLLKRKAALESRTLSQYVRVLLARAMKGDA